MRARAALVAALLGAASVAHADAPKLHTVHGAHFAIDLPVGAELDADGNSMAMVDKVGLQISTSDETAGLTAEQAWSELLPELEAALVKIDGPRWTTERGVRWAEGQLTRPATTITAVFHGLLAVVDGRGYAVQCGTPVGPHGAPITACDPLLAALRVGTAAATVIAGPDEELHRGDGWAIALPGKWDDRTAANGQHDLASSRAGEAPIYLSILAYSTTTTLAELTATELGPLPGAAEPDNVHVSQHATRVGSVAGVAYELRKDQSGPAIAGTLRVTVTAGRELVARCLVKSPTAAAQAACATIVRSLKPAAPAKTAP